MNHRNIILSGVLMLIGYAFGHGQDTIFLKNPSFEGPPHKGGATGFGPILGWTECEMIDYPHESPPDIISHDSQIWGVNTKALDGDTYLSMVTRYDGSWESVSQMLSMPLDSGKYYQMSALLSMASFYRSHTPRSMPDRESFTNPVVLKIWGSNDLCQTDEILAVSTPVSHKEWRKYIFELNPIANHSCITIQVFYRKQKNAKDGHRIRPYNGHMLVDRIGPIIEIKK